MQAPLGGRGGRLILGPFDCFFVASGIIVTSSYADVCLWHKADLATCSINVCFRGNRRRSTDPYTISTGGSAPLYYLSAASSDSPSAMLPRASALGWPVDLTSRWRSSLLVVPAVIGAVFGFLQAEQAGRLDPAEILRRF